MAFIGGSSATCGGGLGAAGSSEQIKAGAQDDADAFFTFLMENGHQKNNEALSRLYADHSGEMIDWLLSNGVALTSPEMNDQPYGDYVAVGTGAALMQTLGERINENEHITLMLQTKAEELVTADGAVVGVKATAADGSEVEYYAPATAICTGGYGANNEMLADLAPGNSAWCALRDSVTETGDGIRMAEAAGPDVIDINFGCPVKKIAGRGAGSGMMRDVPLMVEMTRRIVAAVKKPVTVKTRLGWDEESKNIEEIALRLQDVGIAALTIHGRTRAQMYRGEADWTLIGKVKNNPQIRIPIIGNGDVDSGPKAREMFDRYGVDGVMIGRATYGRPWIFREVKHYLSTGEALPQPSVAERVAIAKEHLQKSLEIKGDHVGILEMRRHMTNYFKGLPDFKSTRLKLVTSLDTAELFATLDEIACRWGGYDLSEAVPAPLSHNL